jgi:hypothetical protein
MGQAQLVRVSPRCHTRSLPDARSPSPIPGDARTACVRSSRSTGTEPVTVN